MTNFLIIIYEKNSKKNVDIFIFTVCVYCTVYTVNTVLYAQYILYIQYIFLEIFLFYKKKYSAREPIFGQTVQYSLKQK